MSPQKRFAWGVSHTVVGIATFLLGRLTGDGGWVVLFVLSVGALICLVLLIALTLESRDE